MRSDPASRRRREARRRDMSADLQAIILLPVQPCLDGFAVAKGVIRQVVAMPLGAGFTAEARLTGAASGGRGIDAAS